MEFTKKKYHFKGMDGFAGFRHGQDYELEVAKEDEGNMVFINPVSRLYMYPTQQQLAEWWQPKK